MSLRSVARIVHFTEVSVGYTYMGLYAFFTMVIFGSMYYIVPRLIGREWRYASLIKLHFWCIDLRHWPDGACSCSSAVLSRA